MLFSLKEVSLIGIPYIDYDCIKKKYTEYVDNQGRKDRKLFFSLGIYKQFIVSKEL